MDCSLAEQFFTLNDQVAAERAANTPAEGAAGFQPSVTGSDSGAGRQAGQERRGGGGGRRGGSQAAASAPRGSYSSPDSSSLDSGYGAPADFGGSLGGYGGRRRNARGLDPDTVADDFIDSLDEEEEY